MLVYTRPGHRRECLLRAQEMGGVVWPVMLDFKGVSTWSGESTQKDVVESIRARCSCNG